VHRALRLLAGSRPALAHEAALARPAETQFAAIGSPVIVGEVTKTVKNKLPSPLFLAMRTGLVHGFMAHRHRAARYQ
jgi:hypothetical protein